METIKLSLNSNFFIALTTLLVGSFAIFLYLKRKNDFKREAANILLMEIRNAEQMIDKYINGGVSIGVNVELFD